MLDVLRLPYFCSSSLRPFSVKYQCCLHGAVFVFHISIALRICYCNCRVWFGLLGDLTAIEQETPFLILTTIRVKSLSHQASFVRSCALSPSSSSPSSSISFKTYRVTVTSSSLLPGRFSSQTSRCYYYYFYYFGYYYNYNHHIQLQAPHSTANTTTTTPTSTLTTTSATATASTTTATRTTTSTDASTSTPTTTAATTPTSTRPTILATTTALTSPRCLPPPTANYYVL